MDSSRSDLWTSKKKKTQNPVFLEGYVESYAQEEDHCSSKSVSRTVSLTDEDLDELKGCVDLGFGFNYEEIPELCGTLPALELCYSIQQKFLDDQNKSSSITTAEENADSDGMNENEISSVSTTAAAAAAAAAASPIANWKISSPGDNPEEVKARLKYWAQAVACTVKLCS